MVNEHYQSSARLITPSLRSAATDGPKDRANFTSKGPDEPATMAEYGTRWFETLSFTDWGSLAEINVASVFFVTMAFLGLLEESAKTEVRGQKHSASVINISSAGPHMSLSFGYVSYCIFFYKPCDPLHLYVRALWRTSIHTRSSNQAWSTSHKYSRRNSRYERHLFA